MTIEQLYPLVSEAIRRAETLEDLGAPGTSSAYLDVSLLEEKVAEFLPASDPEGALARRGAVRAALAAQELTRAQQLAERFLAESARDAELLKLSEQAARAVAGRYPKAAARVDEVAEPVSHYGQRGITVPLTPEEVEAAERVARSEGSDLTELLHRWITERLTKTRRGQKAGDAR